MSILERIYSVILSLRGGGIVPISLRLSQDTCYQLLEEETLIPDSPEGFARVLEEMIGLDIEIVEEHTDVIVAKEIFPDRCPTCGENVAAASVLLRRTQQQGYIRCSNGHTYKPEVRILYLNIFQKPSDDMRNSHLEVCPQCNSKNLQYLRDTDAFCLDCEWYNMKRM